MDEVKKTETVVEESKSGSDEVITEEHTKTKTDGLGDPEVESETTITRKID